MTSAADAAHEPHPLFPLGLDEDPDTYPEVGWVYVGRYEGSRVVYCPRGFTRDELTSEEDVWRLFGGGRYVLQAKDTQRRRWTRRREEGLELPGPSRPLVPPGLPGSAGEEAPTAAAPAAGPGPALDPVVMVLLQQGQQQHATSLAMLQMLGTVMAAAVGGRQDGGAAQVLAAQVAATAQQTQAVLGLVKESMQHRGESGGSNGDSLAQGLELGLALANRDDPLTSLAGQVLAGAQAAQAAQAAAGLPAGGATP